MAEQTITKRTCDRSVRRGKQARRCGEASGDPIKFSWDGRFLIIDLCDKHRAESPTMTLMELVEDAREDRAPGLGNQRKTYSYTTPMGDVVAFDAKTVRDWLTTQQRKDIPETGRLPQHFIEEFKSAHESQPVG
jgi:hypothetical protein